MASNTNNPLANQQMLGGLAGQAVGGLGQYVGTTTTTAGIGSMMPGQLIYPTTWTYPPTPPDPFPAPFPNYPHALGFIGHFRIRQLENGYIVEYQLKEGDRMREYFAEDLKDAGERITALCVEKALKGETPK